VKLRVPVHDDLRNAAGAPVHGGVLATLVDAAIGGALGTYGAAAAGGTDQATLDLNVSFVGAARGDAIFAEGRILRRGRSIAFGETRVTDAAGTRPRTRHPDRPGDDRSGVEARARPRQRPMPNRNSSRIMLSGTPSNQARM
jgi:uncharacterized protein (TIGR00369 family)